MRTYVAWLRGINVGTAGKGRRSVPMAGLRSLAEGLGYSCVRTYIQSGNLVFDAKGQAAAFERELGAAIETRFGHAIPVVVSTASAVRALEGECPFPEAAEARPKLVHVGFAKGRISAEVPDELARYCTAGERALCVGRQLWIDFPSGVARSKLTPAVLDRCVGSPVTLRNLLTVRAVAAILDQP